MLTITNQMENKLNNVHFWYLGFVLFEFKNQDGTHKSVQWGLIFSVISAISFLFLKSNNTILKWIIK